MTEVSKMPKIELHCHLDGSVSLETAQRILKEQGEDYEPEKLAELMHVPRDCRSLAEYLERFAIPVRCIQTAKGLEETAYDLAVREAADNVKYLEVRFAPSLSTSGGMSHLQITECVEKGLARARLETGIRTGIIVCAMRDIPLEENMKMYRACREMLGAGVVGCDLAGDEASYPTALFREMFKLARSLDMPFTIHSGETGDWRNIAEAFELGARRIGHGVAMRGQKELKEFALKHRIGVEMCPTSNLQTKAIDSLDNYPLREFLEYGIAATVCTDNITASNISHTHELTLVRDAFGLDEDEMRQLYRNAIEVAFTDDGVKDSLWKLW